MMATSSGYLLCIENSGYAASLELKKVYRQITDAVAHERQMVRVEDESGEDYLYPARFFVPVVVPDEATRIFLPDTA